MPKKLKSLPAAALTLPDIEAILAKVADLQWTLDQMRADQAEKARLNDAQIAVIRAPFLAEQQRVDETINALEKTISAHVGQVKEWALINPHRFEKRRSLELLCATIGFRFTPPKVETLKGWTFGVCAVALAKLAWGRKYLKAPAVDKEGLLRDRDLLASEPARLGAVGLQIAQTDEFYVELKREHTDAVSGRAAA